MKKATKQTAAKKSPSKSRILYLCKILSEETDPESGLSLPEIQDKLADYGISCERKALYRDFEALDDMGIAIGKIHTRPVRYFMESRPFEPAQMTLLVDAVQSSRSITKNNSSALIRKLKKLVSKNQAKAIDARVHVSDRVKMQNESVFHSVDLIQRALVEKRDISFNYMRYDVRKNLEDVAAHDGNVRVKTPLMLVYNSEKYYMLAYDEESRDHIRSYRVDRMHNILLLGKSDKSHKLPADFDIATYEKQSIDMFSGKPQVIKLQVAEELVGPMIDLFGADDVECSEAKDVREAKGYKPAGEPRRWANMRVKAAPSAVFFGRIAQFGGDVRIKHPQKVVDAYEDHLKKTLKAQQL